MIAADLERLFAAIATPYDADGDVDHGRLSALVEHYIDRGVEGIYCCGSSGEGLLLDTIERTEVVSTIVRTAGGRIPVVAHIGAVSTRDSTMLARAAQDAGATAVSMIPPIYYSYTAAAVIHHYRTVIDAITIPMIVYNIPQFTGVEFDAILADALLTDDRVIGVKHTAHNMYALERMRQQYPDKAYLNGFDEVYLSALAAGARGTIGTTVGMQVELFAAVRDAAASGDLDRARMWQTRINETIDALVRADVFPAAKYLSGRTVGDLGPCREPFLELPGDHRQTLDRVGAQMDEYIADARSGQARSRG